MFSNTQKDKEGLNNDKEQLKAHAREGAAHVKDDVRRATDAIRDDLSMVSDDVAQLANHAGRELRGFVDTAGESVNEATNTMRTQIRENPMTASIMTLVAGMVIGAFMARR